MIVGLSGYAQSGKDTFASFLVEDHGFERLAFADKLRDMLYALNPVTRINGEEGHDLYKLRVSEVVDAHGWEWCKANTDIRDLLQRLGTEAGRKVLGENVWVDACLSKVKVADKKNYVITDCRFVNEAEAIRDRGGEMVRIQRADTSAVNRHVSETALDNYRFDFRVANTSTLTILRQAATSLVEQLKVTW